MSFKIGAVTIIKSAMTIAETNDAKKITKLLFPKNLNKKFITKIIAVIDTTKNKPYLKGLFIKLFT
jgi:predicted transcriptional regulator